MDVKPQNTECFRMYWKAFVIPRVVPPSKQFAYTPAMSQPRRTSDFATSFYMSAALVTQAPLPNCSVCGKRFKVGDKYVAEMNVTKLSGDATRIMHPACAKKSRPRKAKG